MDRRIGAWVMVVMGCDRSISRPFSLTLHTHLNIVCNPAHENQYEALALLFIDAAAAGGAGGTALQAGKGEGGGEGCVLLRQCLQRVGLSPAEYRCVLGDFGLPSMEEEEGGAHGQ